MDKYKRLMSNTALFAISTFSSKVLGIFLTTYHTHMMVPDDFGSINVLITIGNFLIPVVSLGISNAVIRFGLERGVSKKQVFTNGLLCVGMGFVLLLALWPLLSRVPFLGGNVGALWPLLMVFVLVSCLRTLCCQFVRAKEYVRLYAIDGILCTATNLGFNILFISGFGFVPEGIVLSMICSDACSTIFLFCISSLWRYISARRFNRQLLGRMLRYSLPLISASIFWSITNMSDQLFIADMMGNDANGLLTACYKLPTLLTIVATLFTEAWQLSAFTDGSGAGREAFFTKVFGAYQSVMFMAAAGIILLCRPIMSVYVQHEYYIGWMFVPIFTMATVFSSFDNFLNSIYMVEKRSGLSLATMGVGAALNLLLNWLLIPQWGVNGAAIATFASYFAVFILRAVNTRSLIRVNFHPAKLTLNLALLLAESYLLISVAPYWEVLCTLITLVVVGINFQSLWQTAFKLLHRDKKRA